MINTKTYNKYLLNLFFLLVSGNLFAQGDVEMADQMRQSGKIYVVVGVLLLIFIGIAIFLFLLDRKVSRLEKKL